MGLTEKCKKCGKDMRTISIESNVFSVCYNPMCDNRGRWPRGTEALREYMMECGKRKSFCTSPSRRRDKYTLISETTDKITYLRTEDTEEGEFDSEVEIPRSFIDQVRSETAEAERERIKVVLVKEGYLKSTTILHPKPEEGRCGCCYCHICKQHNDDCVCSSNELNRAFNSLKE